MAKIICLLLLFQGILWGRMELCDQKVQVVDRAPHAFSFLVCASGFIDVEVSLFDAQQNQLPAPSINQKKSGYLRYFTVSELKPKSSYQFRVKLIDKSDPEYVVIIPGEDSEMMKVDTTTQQGPQKMDQSRIVVSFNENLYLGEAFSYFKEGDFIILNTRGDVITGWVSSGAQVDLNNMYEQQAQITFSKDEKLVITHITAGDGVQKRYGTLLKENDDKLFLEPELFQKDLSIIPEWSLIHFPLKDTAFEALDLQNYTLKELKGEIWSDVTQPESGKSYAVKRDEAITLTHSGMLILGKRKLNYGWNLVGIQGLSTIPVAEFVKRLNGCEPGNIWSYSAGQWLLYQNDPEKLFLNTLTELKPYQGFFVFINKKEGCTYENSSF